MKTLKYSSVLLAWLALYGIVGTIDMEDAKAERINYCEKVKAGDWPDYDHTYSTECPK